ncbi:MAG: cellulase family glycosylhydrolase [Chitinophagaceae bacterium]
MHKRHRIRKFLLISLLVCVLLLAALWFYLFQDHSYPVFNTTKMVKVSSNQIPIMSFADTAYQVGTDSVSPYKTIRTDGPWFKDTSGRTLFLRGVNLAGDAKVPSDPNLPTYVRKGFFSDSVISFRDRPFPLADADRQFERLKKWGFRFVRWLVTWEGVEHAGPGEYDTTYINDIYQLIRRANQYGITVFIDPHQDAWSRFSGGDGAPRWTFDKLGMDVRRFQVTGAALVGNVYGKPLPNMIWPTNYSKFAAATLFSLFFAGNTLAPKTFIDGIPVQDYLQDHYIAAMRQLAIRLKSLPNVIGFDTFNEPSSGWIGMKLNSQGLLTLGDMPTPYQAMLLASGMAQRVSHYQLGWDGFKVDRKDEMNRGKLSLWKKGYRDIWVTNGVWGLDPLHHPVLKQPDYFREADGHPINFNREFFRPFILKYAAAIRSVDPRYLIFAEPVVMPPLPLPEFCLPQTGHFVNAGHWYDGITLFTKKYFPFFTVNLRNRKLVLGKRKVRRLFDQQVSDLKAQGKNQLKGRPTLVGECGIPFDLNQGEAYRSGNFSDQAAAMDRTLSAMEKNLVGYAIWNYTPDNTNSHGDHWNGEDLSIFSKSQQKDPADINSGGRALDAVIRPYPYALPGTPTRFGYEYKKRKFFLQFTSDPKITAPAEIFLPEYEFGKGYRVDYSDGRVGKDKTGQYLLYYPSASHRHHTLLVSAGL